MATGGGPATLSPLIDPEQRGARNQPSAKPGQLQEKPGVRDTPMRRMAPSKLGYSRGP